MERDVLMMTAGLLLFGAVTILWWKLGLLI
jgi:hypothetical protein